MSESNQTVLQVVETIWLGYNVMEYVTTSTLGNTSDFGDMVAGYVQQDLLLLMQLVE